MVICLERGANDLHIVQLMPPPPHHLLLHLNPEWFGLSGASLPRLSWTKRLLNVCLSVCLREVKLLSGYKVKISTLIMTKHYTKLHNQQQLHYQVSG